MYFGLQPVGIVVLSTSSPFHPEKPKPCIGGHVDQPPATLVKFGSSKVKAPFFFFLWSTYFEFRVLGSQGMSSAEPAAFKRSCGLFKVSGQISRAWNGSPHQCSATRCCDFSPGRMEKPRQPCRSRLLPPGALVPAVLPGGAPGRAVMGSASGWPVWQILPKS